MKDRTDSVDAAQRCNDTQLLHVHLLIRIISVASTQLSTIVVEEEGAVNEDRRREDVEFKRDHITPVSASM